MVELSSYAAYPFQTAGFLDSERELHFVRRQQIVSFPEMCHPVTCVVTPSHPTPALAHPTPDERVR